MYRNWDISPDRLSESVKVKIFQTHGMKYWGKFEYMYKSKVFAITYTVWFAECTQKN